MKQLSIYMCRILNECIVKTVEKTSPGIYGKIGVDELEDLRQRYASLPDDKIPVDWVAFGFPEHPFYELHMGMPFRFGENSLSLQVGFHITDPYLKSISLSMEPIKNFEYKGMRLQQTTHPATGEHMFVFPSVPVIHVSAGSCIQTAIEHGSALYDYMYSIIRTGTIGK